MKMNEPPNLALRLLVVEDSEDDFRLVQLALAQDGVHAECMRVDTAAALEEALCAGGWDAVISDFNLPALNGFEVLARLRARDADLPFLLVSGRVGEQVAVEVLHRDGNDCVMKDNLPRLALALRRSLREAAARRERREAVEALRESEAKYRDLIEHAADGIWIFSPEGRFVVVNRRCCEITGYTREELLAMNPLRAFPEQDGRALLARLRAGERLQYERVIQRRDGTRTFVEIAMRMLADGCIEGIARDVTARREAEDHMRRVGRLYAVLSDIKTAIVRMRDRETLFREACRIAVETGGFRSAWIGVADRAAGVLRRVAEAGETQAAGVPERLPLTQGVVADALRAGHASLSTSVSTSVSASVSSSVPAMVSTVGTNGAAKAAPSAYGAPRQAYLPLVLDGEPAALFVLEAGERDFAGQREIELLDGLAGDISFALNHIDKLERLDYLAYYDGLTGLPNRNSLDRRLRESITRAQKRGRRFAMGISDIDGFKNINDTLGEEAGDELLRQVARRMTGLLQERCLSTPVRVGTDQFAVVTGHIDGEEELMAEVETMRHKAFGPPYAVGGTDLRLSVRSGVAIYPDHGGDARTLLKHAEAALKEAKARGEPHLLFDPRMAAQVAAKLGMVNSLRRALEHDEFVLHYQPKVDFKSGAITGFEALIRWNDPASGRQVPPMEFIPVLEETGLIVQVGDWALRQAARDQMRWRRAGIAAGHPDALRVAVNVSAMQLRRKDFVATVAEALRGGAGEESGSPAIDLEVTESLLMEDFAGNVEKLRELSGMGVNVAIDDFGTGYSSLAYLARLPARALKIDRSFVITMLSDRNIMTVVTTIISLAHSLRLKVVAEGVDSEEQSRTLKLLRCDQMQGYLFSRPVPAECVPGLLGAPHLARRVV
jgi:diguanylate cyclase (GGDEF)-like protein/PAS domain S-box-containing protein